MSLGLGSPEARLGPALSASSEIRGRAARSLRDAAPRTALLAPRGPAPAACERLRPPSPRCFGSRSVRQTEYRNPETPRPITPLLNRLPGRVEERMGTGCPSTIGSSYPRAEKLAFFPTCCPAFAVGFRRAPGSRTRSHHRRAAPAPSRGLAPAALSDGFCFSDS